MSQICVLDENNCLSLYSILKAFHCGIKEEQSWALIHQSIISLKQYISQNYENLVIKQLLSSSHFFIKNNGTIHHRSWHCSDTEKRVNTKQIISSIGLLIYEALDYGNSTDEERVLMSSLEHVLDIMTQELVIDEGIDQTDDGSDEKLIDNILESCRNHIFDNSDVGEHYRNVCRALVAEALDMSTFLSQVSFGTKELQKSTEINSEVIDNFHVEVWAHLWMKVMRELRVGVTLKSIDEHQFRDRQQREYELTPFEMLLDDISSKRYTLKKVMSFPMKVEKDARNMILQFIRSRPPLKPVNERQLKPMPQMEPSLHQKLMESIRQGHALKPTPPPFRRKFDSFYIPRDKFRDKRRSNIYPLNSSESYSEITTNGSPPEPPKGSVSPFRRLSFRNLSLRIGGFDPNKVVVGKEALEASQTTRKRSFLSKLYHSIWE